MPISWSIHVELSWGKGRRCYLTRSANVTGLLGHDASLLISSSGICPAQGGRDQEGTAGGKVAGEVYHRTFPGLSLITGLQALARVLVIDQDKTGELSKAGAFRDAWLTT